MATTTEPTEAGPRVKRHPVRGLIWGFVLGIGIAIYLVIFAVIAFGTLTPFVVIGLTTIAGGLWGLFAPPKKPKGDKETEADEPLAPLSIPPTVQTGPGGPPSAAGKAEPPSGPPKA